MRDSRQISDGGDNTGSSFTDIAIPALKRRPSTKALIKAICSDYRYIHSACRLEDVRRTTNEQALSEHDAYILAHIDQKHATSAAQLATYLGLARSTIGDILQRFKRLGLIVTSTTRLDKKTFRVTLTDKGVEANTSYAAVDIQKLRGVLSVLTAAEQHAALSGLALLARAAKEATVMKVTNGQDAKVKQSKRAATRR